ncbi:ABC transporter ATP-binding protein [Mesoplasma entomophilum]|uniref:ABC transporter ATP-binding protein n=1 Tax=Mesoplasma entomophilum TaxID=2149 RepID=UPI000D03F2CA|nr:ATP-binding cassette domain-containing protein [Mesoplasma entomophilum]AVN60438.1 ABC transporter ATP-binding protein [Mesoplasma entomophilum]
MKELIKVNNLTKEFKNGHGIYDINLSIREGEVFGYLGPNGAGKSTTIRHILGFMKPQKGTIIIDGINAWKDADRVNSILGYVPGEIAMPEFMTGIEFIKYIFEIRKLKDWKYVEELIEFWEFDPKVKIKKMSKGMKQKVSLICAFMHKPKILVLDEPTSGLDPLMQEKFINLIKNIKAEGRTVILSSHIFQEVEKTCDRVAIVKNGRIVSNIDMNEIKYNESKRFEIVFSKQADMKEFLKLYNNKNTEVLDKTKLFVNLKQKDMQDLLKIVAKFNTQIFKEIPFTLEEYFLDFYKLKKEDKVNG